MININALALLILSYNPQIMLCFSHHSFDHNSLLLNKVCLHIAQQITMQPDFICAEQ